MEAFSVEKSIQKGKELFNELFKFVEDKAIEYESYPMEREILLMLMKIGLSAMECYFAKKGTGDVGSEMKLENGSILKRQGGYYPKNYFSVFGKLELKRAGYWKKGEAMIMPLDAHANLPKNCYSLLLQELMNHLSISNAFKEASESLEKFFGLKIYSNGIEGVSHNSCMSYDQFYGAKEKPEEESEGSIQVSGFDGIGVSILKNEIAALHKRLGKGEKRQKKKEAMVGVNYTIEAKERSPEEAARNLVYPEEKERYEDNNKNKVQAQNIRRMASLERSRQEVIKEVLNYARQRDPGHNRPWVIIMDGALNLWSIVDSILSDTEYTGILDIIHVTEYLWDTANTLYGENSEEGKRWVYDHLLEILNGDVNRVITELNRTLCERKLRKVQGNIIEKTIGYFKNHRKWMRYDEYLKKGYPIGSGVVESSCGHTVKNRMEGTGRRWSIYGAESMLLLRSIKTSNDWNAYWEFHMQLEKSFYYHDALIALGIPDDYYELGEKMAA